MFNHHLSSASIVRQWTFYNWDIDGVVVDLVFLLFEQKLHSLLPHIFSVERVQISPTASHG